MHFDMCSALLQEISNVYWLFCKNDKLRHAVCDAYNDGYEKGRCKINYMYGYDIY